MAAPKGIGLYADYIDSDNTGATITRPAVMNYTMHPNAEAEAKAEKARQAAEFRKFMPPSINRPQQKSGNGRTPNARPNPPPRFPKPSASSSTSLASSPDKPSELSSSRPTISGIMNDESNAQHARQYREGQKERKQQAKQLKKKMKNSKMERESQQAIMNPQSLPSWDEQYDMKYPINLDAWNGEIKRRSIVQTLVFDKLIGNESYAKKPADVKGWREAQKVTTASPPSYSNQSNAMFAPPSSYDDISTPTNKFAPQSNYDDTSSSTNKPSDTSTEPNPPRMLGVLEGSSAASIANMSDEQLDALLAETDAEDAAVMDTVDQSNTRPAKLSGSAIAKNIMAKWGLKEGQGLGADGNEGIKNAIQVERKKGGNGLMGNIIARKRKAVDAVDDDGPGKMSRIVLLKGMFKGVDVDQETQHGNLYADIGEALKKFGSNERIKVVGADLYIKFNQAVSALNMVSTIEREGMGFNGNDVTASYWDEQRFEDGAFA